MFKGAKAKAEWAHALRASSLRGERKALWRVSDTVPEAGIINDQNDK